MIDILIKYPLPGLIVLIVTAFLTFIVSSRLYMLLNRHLMTADVKEQKSILKKTASTLLKNIDQLDSNNEMRFYRYCKIKMIQSGYYNKYAVIVFFILLIGVPILILLFFLSINNIFGGIIINFTYMLGVCFILYAERKKIENDWRKNGYKIYRFIHNQISSGVTINNTLKNLYIIGIGTKIEKPLYELSARYGRTLDIDISLQEFKKYFKLPDIDIFCTTLEQGVKLGNIENLIFRQEKSMFRQHFNVIQAETDSCNIKTGIILVLLGGILCVMLTVPMLKDIGTAVDSILSY